MYMYYSLKMFSKIFYSLQLVLELDIFISVKTCEKTHLICLNQYHFEDY